MEDFESGPLTDQNLDRAMDILAIWMASLYKKEHPEEFQRFRVIEDLSANTDSSNDPGHASKQLDVQDEMEYHVGGAIQMISYTSYNDSIDSPVIPNKVGEERCPKQNH